MLQVVILALLVVGCTCIEMYDARAHHRYDNINDCGSQKVPEGSLVDNILDFTVIREKETELVFRPTKGGRFSCHKEADIHLKYISFEFHTDCPPEIHIRLEAPSGKVTWTITSEMFTVPKLETDLSRAEKEAVLTESLDERFAEILDGQREESTLKKAAFKLRWVKELLRGQRPKLESFGIDIRSTDLDFLSLPSVIQPEVFNILEKVKNDMVIPK